MSTRQTNWLFLILIPLLPVISLYWLFQTQNYFGLDGFWKGIVASGPIGAYLFMVWIGWQIFQGLERREIPSGLLGEWDFATVHADPTHPKRRGHLLISLEHDDLQLRGDFWEGETFLGNIHSRFAAWRSGHLYFSYEYTTSYPTETQVVIGLAEVKYNQSQNELIGKWYRFCSTSAGTIQMRKRK